LSEKYKTQSGLWKHEKNCVTERSDVTTNVSEKNGSSEDIIEQNNTNSDKIDRLLEKILELKIMISELHTIIAIFIVIVPTRFPKE